MEAQSSSSSCVLPSVLGDVERLLRTGHRVALAWPGEGLDAEQRHVVRFQIGWKCTSRPCSSSMRRKAAFLSARRHGDRPADLLVVHDLIAAAALGLVEGGVGLGAHAVGGGAAAAEAT